jgi:hypothetical protein
MPGVAAKITAAEARLSSKGSAVAVRRTVGPPPRADVPVAAASVNGPPGRRYSNAAPETQSH